MVIMINLSATEYYKGNYIVDNKIWLKGSITNMDISKRYGVIYGILGSGSLYYVKDNSGNILTIENKNTINLEDYNILANIAVNTTAEDDIRSFLETQEQVEVIIEVVEINENNQVIDWTPSNAPAIYVYNYYDTETEYCDQFFKIEDQNGNPLSGTITFGEDIPVNSQGQASIYVIKNVSTSATAYNLETGQEQTKTFITCTDSPLVFQFNISGEPVENDLIINISNNNPKIGERIEITGQLTDNDIPLSLKRVTLHARITLDSGHKLLFDLTDTSGNPLFEDTDFNGYFSKDWYVKEIDNKYIKFEIYARYREGTFDAIISNYKEINIDISGDIPTSKDVNLTINTDKTEVISGDDLKITGRLTNYVGAPLQFGRVWIYATGGIIKNFLMDESDVVLYADTNSNGEYEINWIVKQMDKDETVELIAMTESSDNYNETQSIPITVTLTDVEEELEEQEECFIDNPLYPLKSDNPCLITDEQATWIKYGAIGLAGLYVFSTVAPIIKGTGKIFEKKVSK